LNNAIAEAFDAKGYFESVNLQACVDAVRASIGTEHAAKVAKMKKSDAAKFAAANVPGTGWLPKQLRTVHYKGPVEAAPEAAKKGKKPKPVKKAPAKKKRK
jgi:ParB family chromosome partitioning protein